MLEVLNRILDWIEKHLPGLLLAFTLGFKRGAKKTEELEEKLIDSKLELEKEKNRRALLEANKGLDDLGIIDRAIRRGKDLLGKGRRLL